MGNSETNKKVLVVSRDRAQAMTDLGELLLTFGDPNARIEPAIPSDFRNYDAIILNEVPENSPGSVELEERINDNPGIPIIASPTVSRSINAKGYDNFVAIISPDKQAESLREYWRKWDESRPEWSNLSNFRIEYWTIREPIMNLAKEKKIPIFEAFYEWIAKVEWPELVKLQTDRLERVAIELDNNAKGYEMCRGSSNEQYFRMAAERELAEYLASAGMYHKSVRSLLKLSGPSVLGGSHYLLVGKASGDKVFNFLKEVKDKDGIPHDIIAKVMYSDVKYFRKTKEGQQGLRVADSRPPIKHNDRSYLLREVVTGPDLERVLHVLRKKIEEGGQRKRWANHYRNTCIKKVLSDIVYWQKNAKPISDPEIPKTPESIVDHLKTNMNKAFETYSKYVKVSKDERDLWKATLDILNTKTLDLNKRTIKRHFDASTSNVKIVTGDRRERFEDLEKLARGERKQAQSLVEAGKRIESAVCYVDQGFTYVHEDEDFFHVTSSFALHDDGESTYQDKIGTVWEWYKVLNKERKKRKKPGLAQRLHGFYRNFMSGHLGLMKYDKEKKGVKGVKERHAHRLGLAEAFANDSVQCLKNESFKNLGDIQDNPRALLKKIRAYKKKGPEKEYNGLTAAQIFGLSYFARKFYKLKL